MDDQPLSLSELETFIDRYEIDVSDNMACKQQQQQIDTDRRYVHVDTPNEPRGEKREANSPLTPVLSDTDNSSSLSMMIKSTQIEKQTRISDFFADSDNQTTHHIQGHHATTSNTPLTQIFAPTSSTHKTDSDTKAFQPSSTSTPMASIFKTTQHSTAFDKQSTTHLEMVAAVPSSHTSMITSAVNDRIRA